MNRFMKPGIISGLGFITVVIDLLFDFKTCRNYQNCPNLLTNLQQIRRIYDRKCNYDGVESQSCIAELQVKGKRCRIGIRRRRNCIYDRKFYDSVVDLLVNLGNFGSLDMS